MQLQRIICCAYANPYALGRVNACDEARSPFAYVRPSKGTLASTQGTDALPFSVASPKAATSFAPMDTYGRAEASVGTAQGTDRIIVVVLVAIAITVAA